MSAGRSLQPFRAGDVMTASMRAFVLDDPGPEPDRGWACGSSPGELFAAVTEELAQLPGIGVATMLRYEADGTTRVLASRAERQVGSSVDADATVSTPIVVDG